MAEEKGFMARHRGRLIVAAIAVFAIVGMALDRNEPAPDDPAPGTFAVAFMGDAPYYIWEDIQFRRVLRQLDDSELAAVVSVGDMFWRPCSDEMYNKHFAYFESLRHPVIYTPGDNEWADCHEPRVGGYEPLDRLATIRRVFFADPTRSLGGRQIELASQGAGSAFDEFVENVRWQQGGVVFATVHLIGGMNGGLPFPGRTGADDDEARRRTAAAAAWVREAFLTARQDSAAGVVIITHANVPGFPDPDDPERRALEPFVTAFEREAAAFAGPVVFVHGDWHEYTVDKPFVGAASGESLDNVTRVQVPGSPTVGWVRISFTAGETLDVEFASYVIPAWKLW